MVTKQRIVMLLVLAGALAFSASTASASISVGTGGMYVNPQGDIYLYAKGICIYQVFIADVPSMFEKVSVDTGLLSYDPGRTQPRNLCVLGATVTDYQVNPESESYYAPEYFGAVILANVQGTATPIYEYDDEDNPALPTGVVGWNSDTKWVDTHVNVDLAGLAASGHSLWLAYQTLGYAPSYAAPLLELSPEEQAMWPYAETPEPATLTLLALGGLAIIRRRTAASKSSSARTGSTNRR